jgi:hypothetical protein
MVVADRLAVEISRFQSDTRIGAQIHANTSNITSQLANMSLSFFVVILAILSVILYVYFPSSYIAHSLKYSSILKSSPSDFV